MNLIDTIDRLVQIWVDVEETADKKILKDYKNEVKDLMKVLKKIERISIEDALFIQKNSSVFDRGGILLDHSWLFSIIRELETIRKRNSEVFTDADAVTVREQLRIAHPNTNEILKFRIKLAE